MSTICNISFIDHEQGVYNAGEVLKCNVQLITKKAKSLKDITILVTGKATVRWKQGSKNSRRTYRSEVLYFSSRNILQHDATQKTFELMPGNHSYSFEMQLPSDLPSSFKGWYGQIHYEVKLILSREILFNNEFVQPFTIISPLDFNQNKLYKDPIDVTKEKSTFFQFFDMAPFKMRVRIPFSAYVPGQSIPCTIEAINESKVECHGINLRIYMHVTYKADFPFEKTRKERIKIQKVVLHKVAISSKENFEASLSIPTTPPSSLDTCSIINICYTVTVEALMEGIHRNMVISIPITIGTCPLFETVPYIDQSEASSSTGNHHTGYARSLSYSMNPPTYEEAMENQFFDEEGSNHIKSVPFTPLYPVLKMEQQPGTSSNAAV